MDFLNRHADLRALMASADNHAQSLDRQLIEKVLLVLISALRQLLPMPQQPNTPAEPSDPTLIQLPAEPAYRRLLKAWRREKRRGGNPKYIDQVLRWLEGLANHASAEAWADVSSDHISEYLDSLSGVDRVDAIGRPIKRGGSGKTVNNALTAFRSFFKWCHERGDVAFNAAKAVSWSKHTRVTRRAFTEDEVQRMISGACDRGSPRRAMLYAFLAVSGCRIGTAELLQWKHIDFTGPLPVISIPAELLKQKREMRVQLSERDASFLMQLRGESQPDPDDLLFGERPHRNVFLADCRAAGVPIKDAFGRGAGPHCFRRFVGTALARERINPKVAQKRLGHKDIRTTLEYYTDEFTLEDEQAASLLSSKVYGISTAIGHLESLFRLDKGTASGQHTAAETAMPHSPQNVERSVPGACKSPAVSATQGAERLGPSVHSLPPVEVGQVFSTRASGVEPEVPNEALGRASVEEIRLQELRLAHRLMDVIERLLKPTQSAGPQGAADGSPVPPSDAGKGQHPGTDRAS